MTDLHRREILRLAAAGAVSFLTPGCPASKKTRPKIPTAQITGTIRGQDDGLGHLLRDGKLARRTPQEERSVDVLVVGGGAAGLSCAWRLRREGVPDVLVLDAGRAAGGNARWGENGITRFPWGAHYLRAPTAEHRSLERFMEEVDLIRGRDAQGRPDWDTRAVCRAPEERLWENGVWREGLFPPPRSGTKADREAYKRFKTRIDAYSKRRDEQGRRAFAIPIEASSRDPELLQLDTISFATWLEREGLLSSPALRWYAEYACRDDYGCTLETTSAWAGLHYFCARASDDPSREAILSWPEGNGRLIQLLLEAKGGCQVETRALCYQLRPGATPSDPSQALVYMADADRVVRFTAKHLVYAGPRFVLDRLLGAPQPGTQDFSYAPWLVINVTLDEPPGGVGFQLAWDNVFYGKPSLGYVVANRFGRSREPCVITWYLPLVGDPQQERKRLLEQDYAALKEQVLAELFEVHPPLQGRVRAVNVWRWGHAMIRPTPGFIWGKRRAALTRSDALLCAHSDLSGISIFEEAFYRGVVAGEQVLRRRGGAFESIL